MNEEIEKRAADAFLKLFDGYQERYLELNGAQTTNDKGKVAIQARTNEGALPLNKVVQHTKGDASIGVAPIRADSTCMFGVLDIDWYNMPEEACIKVRDALRTRCAGFRSKSRGMHVYVFAKEPVSGRVMHNYLMMLRSRIKGITKGHEVEVFPKDTQLAVSPENEPAAVNLPLHGAEREPVFFIDTHIHAPKDDIPLPAMLEHIDEHCRLDADVLKDIADVQQTIDTSDIGYKVPDNPAGRNDLLMRVAMSMQARGWPDNEMAAELHKLNNAGKSFHALFSKPLPKEEIASMLKQARKKEKGDPTPLHYHQVEKFNRRWAKITINGVVEFVDQGAAEFTTFKKQMMFDETSDQNTRVGKSLVPTALLWLRDPDHARFKGVVCEPADYDGPGYNVWRGFAVSPKDGDPNMFVDYITNVLCGGDAGLAHWLTMWLADAVQRPTEPSPPTAVALRGKQGGGKSFLQERILTPIFGERYVSKVQESERLFAQFNRNIFGSTFIAAEESIFHGSEATASKLKSFISSDSWTYEEKHKAVIQAKNVARLIASTNSEQAVHLDGDDRRWTIIEVEQPFDMTTAEGQAAAFAFWEPYHAFMRSDDGPRIVLNYLLNYDVDRAALTFGYGTEAKARDKIASDPVMIVLHEIATDGIVPHDQKARGHLSNKTLVDLVHKAGGRNLSPEDCAHRLLTLLPLAETCRKAQYCERIVQVRDDNDDVTLKAMMLGRQRGYDLGSLKELREAVSRLTMVEYGDDDLPTCEEPEFVNPLGWLAWNVASDTGARGELPF